MSTSITNRLPGGPEEYFLAGQINRKPSESAQRDDLAPAAEKHKVLIVDDDHVIADTLVEILNDSGFEATAVYDGVTALEQVSKLCPDTLIIDFVMPEINGIELAKATKRICPGTRVLLLSGQATTTNLIDQARKEGYSFELLAKPIPPQTLLEKLKQE